MRDSGAKTLAFPRRISLTSSSAFTAWRGRARERTKARGIGLALGAELVGLHGGSIRASSVVGQGTALTVVLPAGALPSTRRPRGAGDIADSAHHHQRGRVCQRGVSRWLPEASRPGTASQTASESGPSVALLLLLDRRILVADDNPDMRSYVARILRTHWRVDTVENGEAALEKLRGRSVRSRAERRDDAGDRRLRPSPGPSDPTRGLAGVARDPALGACPARSRVSRGCTREPMTTWSSRFWRASFSRASPRTSRWEERARSPSAPAWRRTSFSRPRRTNSGHPSIPFSAGRACYAPDSSMPRATRGPSIPSSATPSLRFGWSRTFSMDRASSPENFISKFVRSTWPHWSRRPWRSTAPGGGGQGHPRFGRRGPPGCKDRRRPPSDCSRWCGILPTTPSSSRPREEASRFASSAKQRASSSPLRIPGRGSARSSSLTSSSAFGRPKGAFRAGMAGSDWASRWSVIWSRLTGALYAPRAPGAGRGARFVATLPVQAVYEHKALRPTATPFVASDEGGPLPRLNGVRCSHRRRREGRLGSRR